MRVRALCCVCGTLRTTTVTGHMVGEAWKGREVGGRCLISRKCATCGERTVHAYLRDMPSEAWCRDTAEKNARERHEALRWQVYAGCGWDMGPYDAEIDA